MVVHIPGNDKILSLAEVGVYGDLAGNRAVRGAATQSSTSGDWFAGKAIDSNRGLQQLYTGCSSTLNQTNPWWRLDLLDMYRVSKVVITNRRDCCTERINGAEIRIGNSLENNGSNNPICAVIPAIPAGESYNYSCDGMDGRYVIVHIPGDQKILALCEVEIYGYLAENLAVAGVATQSSTSGDGFAEKAVDRGLQQLYTGCSSTLSQTNPWWRLDLRHIYRVSKVVVTNRRDCCAEQINGVEIRIGNSLENNGSNNPICAVIPAIPAGESYNYSCGGMEGRYVNLIIPGDMKTLTLCEVKVYGEGPALKRSFVKMQFNSINDLTDPSMRENVLKQLGSALADRGLTNVTLRWTQTPERVIQKGNDDKQGANLTPRRNRDVGSGIRWRLLRPETQRVTELAGRYPEGTRTGQAPQDEVNTAQPGGGCPQKTDPSVDSTGFVLVVERANGQEENAALWGEPTQSSIYGGFNAEHALDGLVGTWSHTNPETNPWWRVDLLKVYIVNRVTITNRNTNPSRINGAVIRVGNFPDIYSNTIIAASATATFSCGGMVGRYMVVHIPGNQRILSLAEVGVYGDLAGNRAVRGAATQSSTSGNWFAGKAIDSNRGLQQLYTGCSSTLNQTNPWWRLDLRYIYRVSNVVVTNRRDCCAERINGAEIRIGNSLENNGNNNPICAVIPAIPAGESYNYSCGGMEGRYVNLIVPGDMKTLTLCEVKVYGEGPALKRSFVKMQFNSINDLTDPSMRENVLKQLGSALADRGLTDVKLRWTQTPERVIQKGNDNKQNLAVDGAATQSSTSGEGFAEKAVDRGLQQLYTGCSSTLNQTNPWWRLDLRYIYRVSNVVVTNRRDCCAEQINGAEIRIGNSLENNGNNNPICAVIPAIPAGESYNYSCGGMEGRYVNLIVPGDMKTLTLCEVKVYGEGPCLKRSLVKMQFNSINDLTDPSMRENVLKQLGSALADRGLTDVKLRWTQTPERVIQKGNDNKRPCENRKFL
ncbi:uncharacterized protein LOC120461291 [Pimephales promelas]|uniref:uncharacterized protein LOC120461291 n=1 Tax=Pimephales promelas TaxID=90988 RepID=UPI00195577B0|nr:uncharacterized protein LOC120461291 [Pimephales promelas]